MVEAHADAAARAMNIVAEHRPTVSVIMPIYNIEAYIADAIDSVLGQSFRDLELIIVNDGSTDRSLEIATEFAAADERVRLVSQHNQGLSAARNRGIDMARGCFVYFLDGDDILVSNALEICITHARHESLDLVIFSGEAFGCANGGSARYAMYRRPDRLDPVPGERLLENLASRGAFAASVCLYLFRAELMETPKLRFSVGAIHEDEGFTPILFCRARRAICLSLVLFRRRVRGGSITQAASNVRTVDGLVRAAWSIASAITAGQSSRTRSQSVLHEFAKRRLREALWYAVAGANVPAFERAIRRDFDLQSILLIDPLLHRAFGDVIGSGVVRTGLLVAYRLRQCIGRVQANLARADNAEVG